MPRPTGYQTVVLEFLGAAELLAGIDERHGGLFVPPAPGLSAGDRVMAEVAFKGQTQRFALRATVRWVRASGTDLLPAGVALDVHKDDLSKLRKVAAWARGQNVQYVNRSAVRYPTEMSCTVVQGENEAEGLLLDVSEGGAFVARRGELPSMGDTVEIRVRLPGTLRASKFAARVMWLDFFEESRGFGVQWNEPNSPKVQKLVERARSS